MGRDKNNKTYDGEMANLYRVSVMRVGTIKIAERIPLRPFAGIISGSVIRIITKVKIAETITLRVKRFSSFFFSCSFTSSAVGVPACADRSLAGPLVSTNTALYPMLETAWERTVGVTELSC